MEKDRGNNLGKDGEVWGVDHEANSRRLNAILGKKVLEVSEIFSTNIESDDYIEGIPSSELTKQVLYEERGLKNLFDINASPERAEENLIDYLENVRGGDFGADVAVGLVSGSFDVPHDNHTWYLRQCKVELAKKFCEDKNIAITKDNIRKAISMNLVNLVVMVDTDEEINIRKTKPNDKRPIYDLNARANRTAQHAIEVDGKMHRVADMVIPEGPEYSGTLLGDMKDLASWGQENGLIDYAIIFGEHKSKIDNYNNDGIKTLAIPEDGGAFAKDKNGNPYSSSAIIRAVRNQ